jgi:hypothetical protein
VRRSQEGRAQVLARRPTASSFIRHGHLPRPPPFVQARDVPLHTSHLNKRQRRKQARPLLRPPEARPEGAVQRPRAQPQASPCTLSYAGPTGADLQCGALVHLDPEIPAGSVYQQWGGRLAHADAEATIQREPEAPPTGVSGYPEREIGGWGGKGTIVATCMGCWLMRALPLYKHTGAVWST